MARLCRSSSCSHTAAGSLQGAGPVGGREREKTEMWPLPLDSEPFKAWLQASLAAAEPADFLVLVSAGGSTDTSFPWPWSPGVRLE